VAHTHPITNSSRPLLSRTKRIAAVAGAAVVALISLAFPGDVRAQLCVVYAVEDHSVHDSQISRGDQLAGTTLPLGGLCNNCDIEALAINENGRLLGLSGGGGNRSNSPLERGDLFEVDKDPNSPTAGELTVICNTGRTGSDELVSAGFAPGENDTLWAFQQDFGIVTVDTANCDVTDILEVKNVDDQFDDNVSDNWEGLAWDLNGEFLYGTDATDLYRYERSTGEVLLVCDNIETSPGQVEALSFVPIPDPDRQRMVGASEAANAIQIDFPGSSSSFPGGPADWGGDVCTITNVSDEILPGRTDEFDIESIEFEAGCVLPVCGDGMIEPPEQCENNADCTDPGAECIPPGQPGECMCSVGCGNNVIDPGEECDGTADDVCPGRCLPPGDPMECTCSDCGDGTIEPPEDCETNADCTTGSDCDPVTCMCSAVCGDDVTDPGEECDGSDDSACPGQCFPPGDPNECMCPVCGDGVVTDPEECETNADCTDPGTECISPGDPDECICGGPCGDNVVDPGEECDGTDDSACPGQCFPAGDPLECMCPVCGDGVITSPEECEVDADCTVPGTECDPVTCMCEAVCGDGIIGPGEECDLPDDPCPADAPCNPDTCECNPPCGNGVVEPGLGEECDPPNVDDLGEHCTDGIDNDDDGFIDCNDPDCYCNSSRCSVSINTNECRDSTESPFCAECITCNRVCDNECKLSDCPPIKRDPAIIRDRTPTGFFSIHGRFDACPCEFFPDDDDAEFELAIFGEYFEADPNTGVSTERRFALNGPCFTRAGKKNGCYTRYRYKVGRPTEPGCVADDRLERVSSRFRLVDGTPSYTFKVRANADFRQVCDSELTVQVYQRDTATGELIKSAATDPVQWKSRANGCLFRLKDLSPVPCDPLDPTCADLVCPAPPPQSP